MESKQSGIEMDVDTDIDTENGQLIEIPFSDEVPIDDNDDESSQYTADDDNIDTMDPIPVEMALCIFTGHSDSVYRAAVNPKIPGQIISGGGDDKGFLFRYNCSNGDQPGSGNVIEQIELLGHKDTVTSVGFNFDGTLALTGSYDGTVRIWNTMNGSLLQVLEGPEDIEWAEFHSKGNAVLAGSKDGTVWMWMAHNGQCVQVFAGHDGSVTVGCFSSDGKHVCTGGEDGTVRVWAPKTGACKHSFEGHFGHAAEVTCIASSPDGDMLLSGSADGTIKLLQISGKRVLQAFLHSTQVAAEVEASEPLPEIKERDEARDEDDDEEDGEMVMDSEGSLSVECVGFSLDARWIASGGLDKTLKIWDVINGACRCTCLHPASVVSLAWHSSLPAIATAALDNIVRLWDARTGALVLQLTGHRDLVTSLSLAPLSPTLTAAASDAIVSVSDDHTVRIYHINTRSLLS